MTTLVNHSTPTASVNPVDDIAALLAGDDDEGTADTGTPEEDPVVDDLDPDESEDAAEPSEDPTPEDEDEDEDGSEEEEDPAEEEENEGEELHEMLGISEDQLSVTDDGDFMLNVKVGGKTSKHKLQEVIKNFQLDKNNTHKSEALSQEKKTFEKSAQERVVQIETTLKHSQAMNNMLKSELMAEYNAIDWKMLREADPAEFAAKHLEYTNKYNRVQQIDQELDKQAGVLTAEQKGKAEKAQQAIVEQGYNKMLDNNPAWKDKKTFSKEMGEIRKFCKDTYGFEDENFKHVSDPRLIELIKDAKAFKEGSKFVEKKVKRKLPKFQKKVGGGKRKPKVSKLEKLTSAAKRAKGGSKRDLQTAAVAELLNNG